MTPALSILGLLVVAVAIVVCILAARRHRAQQPPSIDCPALRNSLWTGRDSTLGEVDMRRLDGPAYGVGTAPRERRTMTVWGQRAEVSP